VIEVYRGHQKPEHHFGIYSLYVMFYPQLVAGPIERPQNLLHQFHQPHSFDYNDVTNGLKRMALGFFKKLVIADRLAIFVNLVYNDPHGQTSLSIILATIFFAFQIYCDFSGYSDIAIGAAQVIGFKLMNNFDRPYFSETIAVFWKRWHISLSSWLRDYLFLPLAYFFSRKLRKENYLMIDSNQLIYAFATLITFTLCGLWHGAAWTFVVWGVINGIYLVAGNFIKKPRSRMIRNMKLNKMPHVVFSFEVLVTFALICFSWIFFRAQTFEKAGILIRGIFTRWDFTPEYFSRSILIGLDYKGIAIAVFALAVLFTYEILQTRVTVKSLIDRQPVMVRWAAYFVFINLIFILGIFGSTEFIYFQF
jgi:D-alanyl-lipoteichoic acid acyltransferase DltB (MBOAT superfamily)